MMAARPAARRMAVLLRFILATALVVGLVVASTVGVVAPVSAIATLGYDAPAPVYVGTACSVQSLASVGLAQRVVGLDYVVQAANGAPLAAVLLKSVALGTRAQSVVSGTTLNLRLAPEQHMGETGIPIIGAGTGRTLLPQTTRRLTSQYGAIADDWAKMTSSSYTARNGFTIETHWYENLSTGLRVEPKTKFWLQSNGAG